MEITKNQANSFLLSTKSIDVAIDSDLPKADTVLYSGKQDNDYSGEQIVFDSPGEYEVKNCMIDGVSMRSDSTGYSVLADGIRVAYLPQLESVLDDKQLEAFAAVDVVILPITGDNAEVTTKVIAQLEPKVVIPHSYESTQLDQLAAEFGREKEVVAKCKLAKKEFTEGEQRLVVLE